MSNVLLRYGDLLAGSAALFHQGAVTHAQFDAYLQSVGFGSTRFPGLQGAGVVVSATNAQVPGISELHAGERRCRHLGQPAGTALPLLPRQ